MCTRKSKRWSSVGLAIAAAVCVVGVSSEASAQEDRGIGTFGVDAALMVPTGDFSSAAGLGPGVLADVQYSIDPSFLVTGRAGLLYHFEKHYGHVWQLPLLAGAKYGFGTRGERPYVAGEIGLTSFHFSTSLTNPFTGLEEKSTHSELDLSLALGGGYEMQRWDFRGAVFVVDLGNAGHTMGLLASAGYAFTTF